jgi:hypothetical protein
MIGALLNLASLVGGDSTGISRDSDSSKREVERVTGELAKAADPFTGGAASVAARDAQLGIVPVPESWWAWRLMPGQYAPRIASGRGWYKISGAGDPSAEVLQDPVSRLTSTQPLAMRLTAFAMAWATISPSVGSIAQDATGVVLSAMQVRSDALTVEQRDLFFWWLVSNIVAIESSFVQVVRTPSSESTASGAYQITSTTWAGLRKNYPDAGLGDFDSVMSNRSTQGFLQQSIAFCLLWKDMASRFTDKKIPDWMLRWDALHALLVSNGVAPGLIQYFQSRAICAEVPDGLVRLLAMRFHYGSGSSNVPYYAGKPGRSYELFQLLWRCRVWADAARAICGSLPENGDRLTRIQPCFIFNLRKGGLYPSYPRS